jgi:3-methyladenine DNA glycosylase AlkD
MVLERWREFMRDMKDVEGLTYAEISKRTQEIGVPIPAKTIEKKLSPGGDGQDIMRETARAIELAILGPAPYPCYMAFQDAQPEQAKHSMAADAEIARLNNELAALRAESQKKIVDFYVTRGTLANNWDLVDLSAPYILGAYMVATPLPQILEKLSNSTNLWEQRIAIVSTLMLIRHNMFDDTLRLCEQYLSHPHPLIHKATGWMLREVGKRDESILLDFLDKHYSKMPRTALRYAIERLNPELRQSILQRK